jgi:hypothetical protein
MLAVVSWKCNCGLEVKAMYDADGQTVLRCPTVYCKTTHIITGKILTVWIKDDPADWRELPPANLIVQSHAGS